MPAKRATTPAAAPGGDAATDSDDPAGVPDGPGEPGGDAGDQVDDAGPGPGAGSGTGRRPASGRAAGRTGRGEETRKALLRAAATLFAENGYHATSVPDIVEAAGVGHGTFYAYFRSRREILLELTRQAAGADATLPRLRSQDLRDRIRAEVVWYLSAHVEHIELSKVWHEAASFDAEIAEARRRERARRVARVRAGIERAGGPPGIDPEIAAAALTAMLEEFARRWFVEGDGPGRGAHDVVAAAETITALWLAAIGLGDR